jgi:hypothetical protein
VESTIGLGLTFSPETSILPDDSQDRASPTDTLVTALDSLSSDDESSEEFESTLSSPVNVDTPSEASFWTSWGEQAQFNSATTRSEDGDADTRDDVTDDEVYDSVVEGSDESWDEFDSEDDFGSPPRNP